MPVICSATGCSNRFVKGARKIRFYRFPISKPQAAEQWVRSLGLKNFVPTTNSCLCSEHFSPDCFKDYNGKPFLREGAVPTILGSTKQAEVRTRMHSTDAKEKMTMKKSGKGGMAERRPNVGKSQVYDSQGLLLSCGRDLCDCLGDDCTGCFYPCSKCGSRKCGVECRCNRKWLYEQVEVEGGEITRNKYANTRRTTSRDA